MNYRWLLGLLVSLTSCSSETRDFDDATGGSGGQPSGGGGSSSTPKGGNAATGGVNANGGNVAKGGTSTGGAPGGGAPQGGTPNGGAGNAPNGGMPNGGAGNSGGNPATGGSSGGVSGGAPSGGTGGGMQPGSTDSVLERNGNPARDGHFVRPALTKTAAAKMAFESSFKTDFKGSMYASPLYVANGPGGKGAFIVATADNSVTAVDETTGATIWSKSLGAGAAQGCGFGNDPVGILSTPVIDAKSGTVYVAAAVGTSGGKGVGSHEIYALSLEDGATKSGWPVKPQGMKSGDYSFSSTYQNQRSALSLVNGTLYVGYGGFVGDCNDYHGWIVAVDAADPSKTGAWATLGKGEAIWAAGGFASDGTSVFPVTGNSTSSASARTASDSEAVLRINGLAAFDRADKNHFYPTSWKSMDSADADLGGSNSILFKVPGSTPETVIAAVAKDGHLFILDPTNLGGQGGEVIDLQVSSGAMNIKTAPTAYQTSKGTYLAFSVDNNAECPNNMSGRVLMSVKISPGAPPTADVAWCAPGGATSGTGSSGSTSPISTSTDGKADSIVWIMAGGNLRGYDGDTGEAVFSGAGSCSGIQRWTSPIAVKNRIIAGANAQLCSWAAP
jgi:hypothetical protein